MEFKKSTLPSGLRVLTAEMPQMCSVASMIFIGAGSRYEKPNTNGISHFLEHMLFKGTEKYPTPIDVARSIEGIGGQLNAWTDQDHTAYYNIVPKEHADIGLSVIAQQLFHPLLEKEAIERERGVVIEEINRRFDDPSSYVMELTIELLWPDQPMGWPVIGNKDNILKIDQQDFHSYMKELYSAEAMVVAVAGDVKHKDIVSQVESLFQPNVKPAVLPQTVKEFQREPMINVFNKKTDQAHLALGIRGLSYSDPDRFAWRVLNSLLGQGMSSRLFISVREERGLAYYVRSFIESYQDTGAMFIHAGLNIDKLEQAISAIMEELRKLTQEPVGNEELGRIKEFLKGIINMSMDDTESVASWFGKQELLSPETLTAAEMIERIEKVSSEDIMRVAKKVFQTANLNLAVIGPFKDGDKYKGLLRI